MLKRTTILLSLLLCTLYAQSQTKAVTEEGEEVILHEDGTWKYANIKPAYSTRLDTLKYKKGKDATFLVKSTVVDCGIYIDPKKWSFKSVKGQGTAREYQFKRKEGDAYAVLVSERAQLTYPMLLEVAVDNAKKAAPDAHLVSEDTRLVNGAIIKMLRIDGSIKGSPFSFLGYYYVGNAGTVQFLGYTTTPLFDEYKADIEELLNGFTIINE